MVSDNISNINNTNDTNKVAGRLKLFYKALEALTSDKFILQLVKGCKIELTECPKQASYRETKLNSHEGEKLDYVIKSLAEKGVIEKVQDSHDDEFISTVFLRPKQDASCRMILNLKPLNTIIAYKHFKMENLLTAMRLMRKNCYMASVDLKDAYYTLNIDPEYRKYLRFIWRGQKWQYTALLNGLSPAPRYCSIRHYQTV